VIRATFACAGRDSAGAHSLEAFVLDLAFVLGIVALIALVALVGRAVEKL